MRQRERDEGRRPGLTTEERQRLKELEWVWWFNYHRLLEPIGYIPRAEYEDAYYRRLEPQVEEATLNPTGLR